jgi:G:T-mismatch repair DNA endonuclease (very short patch repair protein)
VTKVVEVFGDFWHSRIFTGKANFDHESELVEAYRDIGMACLIVWEIDVNENPSSVRQRVKDFLAS